MPNTIDLPEIRKATDKEISDLADRIIAGDWITDLPTDYLRDLISRVPLRKRQAFYDEAYRRHPDPSQGRGPMALPAIPEGWTPVDELDSWTAIDDSWLETALRVADHFESFDPRASIYDRPDDRYVKEKHDPEPRHDWIFVRETLGLTLKEAARVIGVDAGTLSRWEQGKRPMSSGGYTRWLAASGEEVAAIARLRAYEAVQKRDGWWSEDLGLTGSDGHEHLWMAMWKPGGTFDKWRQSGTLPAFTPSDAGLVAA